VCYGNSLRDDLVKVIRKTCLYCKKDFETYTGKGESDFCSRGCASAGSVTDYRRQRAVEQGRVNVKNISDISVIAKGLKTREGFKYKELQESLLITGCEFEFEYPLGKYIYDLALKDKMIFVEFDSIYHDAQFQKESDLEKQKQAEVNGWRLIRIRTAPNEIMSFKLIEHLFVSGL
jgi:very-short-patch-repair endonuclease